MRVKKERQAGLSDMAVFAFGAAILSGCIWARNLMMNARSTEMSFEASASKFTSTITLKNFDMSRILIFNKFLKLGENLVKIRFEFQRIKPSET